MASVNGERGSASPRPISALPSVQARALAFTAILIAGICGGLIGSSAVKVGCHGKCATPEGIGGLTGAIMAAVGVSVIAVLVLRAMGEWRTIKEKRQLEEMIAAASAAADREASAHLGGGRAEGIEAGRSIAAGGSSDAGGSLGTSEISGSSEGGGPRPPGEAAPPDAGAPAS